MDLGSSTQCRRLCFNSGPLSAILVLQHLSDMKTVKERRSRTASQTVLMDKNYFFNVELGTSVLMLLIPSFFILLSVTALLRKLKQQSRESVEDKRPKLLKALKEVNVSFLLVPLFPACCLLRPLTEGVLVTWHLFYSV